jgi:hypothetical protein
VRAKLRSPKWTGSVSDPLAIQRLELPQEPHPSAPQASSLSHRRPRARAEDLVAVRAIPPRVADDATTALRFLPQ